MKDIQSLPDKRGIAIQKVGVTDVHLPFTIKMKDNGFQSVLANIRLTVDLPQQYKGTHMSRFVEVLNNWTQKPISSREIEMILQDIAERTDARRAHIDFQFKYFLEKVAPVSGLKGLLDYECSFSGDLEVGKGYSFILGVNVPFTSLCPCSKEISQYGAHNQRSSMNAKVKYRDSSFVWIEDLVALMESQASSPVYPILKRDDEKYVTELAYDNPKFVEDTIRDLVISLRQQEDIVWFDIECVNYESIHNHNAYARHTEDLEERG